MKTTFTKLLQLSEKQIFTLARNVFQGMGPIEECLGHYLYIDNQHPYVLLAHVDTVTIKAVRPKVNGNIITNEYNDPLGGDDRCGVWAIMQIVQRLKDQGQPVPSILLTDGEECGGLGMRQFIKDKKFNAKDVRLLIAFDRKGCNEWVDYISVPKEVKTYIETFGFIEGNGSYSDVRDLSEDTLIPGINLSVGYYHQHTAAEKVHYDELELTINRAIKMCKQPIDKLYQISKSAIWDDYDYKWGGHYGYSGYGRLGFRHKSGAKVERWCNMCERLVDEDQFNSVEHVCNDCAKDFYAVETEEETPEQTNCVTPQEVAEWAMQDATGVNWACLDCGAPMAQCECGGVFDRLNEDLSQLSPDEQEEAWACVAEELVDSDPLYRQLEKEGKIK